MKKVAVYSLLLVAGLILSQVLPGAFPEGYKGVGLVIGLVTMTGLAFIMIHVGFEFDIDKRNPGQYGWDYLFAATAATFPWLFCCLYFVFVMIPSEQWNQWVIWKEALLASRFASPTSAGVLFGMLAAAGLAATWLYRKARILAIFDDLDTILLLIPIQAVMVGLRWQLGAILVIIVVLLWLAWRYLHVVRLPVSWPWVLTYAAGIVAVAETVHHFSKQLDPDAPIHIEVLLPAFAWGCMLARPKRHPAPTAQSAADEDDLLDHPAERRAGTIVSMVFMLGVGLSFPLLSAGMTPRDTGTESATNGLTAAADTWQWSMIALHVLAITVLSNVGKMFVSLGYRREAGWRERLALGISLWPRGEVGAGVLMLSLSYGIGGPVMVVAGLSLALNLVLTGFLILIIRRLLVTETQETAQRAGESLSPMGPVRSPSGSV